MAEVENIEKAATFLYTIVHPLSLKRGTVHDLRIVRYPWTKEAV